MRLFIMQHVFIYIVALSCDDVTGFVTVEFMKASVLYFITQAFVLQLLGLC